MPKSYRRNANEMLFKTDNVCQKVDAKRQMQNTVCQNTHAKNQMLKKCKRNLSSNQHTKKVMKYKKTKEKVNMLQCLSSLKQMNFKMECFSSLLVTINTEVIIFNIRLSDRNNETQLRNSRAVALSTPSRLRFNSSMSLLLGAFDLVYLRNDTKNGTFRP